MKKLTLDLDRLQVESFEPVVEPAKPRGTVRGMDQEWSEEYSCMGTCGYSCRGTCFEGTCAQTCRYSCYGTCYLSCMGTCDWGGCNPY